MPTTTHPPTHVLRGLANDPDLMIAVHERIQDELLDLRNRRVFMLPAANGLVIREADGTDSNIIRIPTRLVPRVVLNELINTLEGKPRIDITAADE